MAKFCAYCGTPLEEGAVCTCRQQTAAPVQGVQTETATTETAATTAPVQPAPQPIPVQPQGMPVYPQGTPYQQPIGAKPGFDFNGFVNTFMKTIGGIFGKPKTAAKEFIESKNFLAGLVMIGINTILSAIFALVFFAKLNGALEKTMGMFSYLRSDVIKFPIFRIFAITFLFSAILSGAFFGITMLIGLIFRENYNLKAALCVGGIRSIVNAPFTILAILVALINPTAGVVLYFLSALAVVLFVQQALSTVLEKTAQYQVYINFGICLLMLLIFYVLVRIGLNVYMPTGVVELLGYFM